jgi:hypothetical protein
VYGKKYAYIAEKTGKANDQINSYLFLGTTYSRLCKYDDAILHLKKCIDISVQFGVKYAEGRAYSALGVIRFHHAHQGQFWNQLPPSLRNSTGTL